MTRRQNADLASAAREYVAQRSAAKVSKATLLKERRALAALASANGSIWVRQVGELQIVRTLAEHSDPQDELLTVLEDFLNWSKHMRYLSRSADPLEKHRRGAAPKDAYYATAYGRCLGCGWIGLVTPRRLEDPTAERRVSTRLCSACAGRLTLNDVMGDG